MIEQESKTAESPSFGLLLILIGLLTLFLAGRIEDPAISDKNDPGPAGLPTAVAVLLIAGGVILTVNWFRKSGGAAARSWTVEIPARLQRTFEGSARRNVWFASGGLTAYVVAIPWLGFSISTFVFGTSLMIRLGSRWWLAILVSLSTVAIIRFVFVGMFAVYLPEGLLE